MKAFNIGGNPNTPGSANNLLQHPNRSFSASINNPDAGGVAGGIGGLTGQGGAGADLHALGVNAGGSSNLDPVPGGPNISPNIHIADFLKVLGNITFWKGIGLVVAGALILVFAALEFKSLSGVTGVKIPRP